ncbi:unnamed protein product [Discula destructiva]
MPGVTGHGFLSRVRSHRKLRTAMAAEELGTPKLVHQRQHSDSMAMTRSASTATRSDYPGHWPPIEVDPLKLNPPVPEAPHAPARLHERRPLQCVGTKRSSTSAANRRPARLHHSDSGFSLHGYQDFDFGTHEKEPALQMVDRDRQRERAADIKGWPSPASSIDSDKSWFDYDNDEEDDVDEKNDEDYQNHFVDTAAPRPQRRPLFGSPDDPINFIKRGEWKRRGIFFGMPAEEVPSKHADSFEV